MTQPVASIIVRCQTTENLDACLKSALSQTLENIEVICIGDGSSGGISNIVQNHAEKSSRVANLLNAADCAPEAELIEGILSSSGQFVMILDSDDLLESHACEMALSFFEDSETDILHFKEPANACAGESERLTSARTDFLSGNTPETEPNPLAFYVSQKDPKQLLRNSVFRGALVRKAADTARGAFPRKARELYLGFLVFGFARGLCETGGTPLSGRRNEVVGRPPSPLEAFVHRCQDIRALKDIELFVQHESAHGDLEAHEQGDLADAVERIKTSLMGDLANKWMFSIPVSEKERCFAILTEEWGDAAPAIASLADNYYEDYGDVFFAFSKEGPIFGNKRPRPIKTVALRYRGIENGGAQHVVAMLCNRFASFTKQGEGAYQVVLITDEPPSARDYPLAQNVERVVIPSRLNLPAEGYEKRSAALAKAIEEHEIDVIIDSLWEDRVLPWDMLTAASTKRKPAYIIHCHSLAAIQYRYSRNPIKAIVTYPFADAVVCLSKSDQWYWSNINRRSTVIDNPIESLEPPESRKKPDKQIILWVGRLSSEKQPMEALRIFEAISSDFPSAHLVFVGDGDEKIKSKLHEECAVADLSGRVHFEGFQADVAPYYREATALLSTSQYEGFNLTLYEAASQGTPIIMYELPYLTFGESHEGWIEIPGEDRTAAAKALSDLLRDEEKWSTASERLLSSSRRFASHDPIDEWVELLGSIEKDSNFAEPYAPAYLQLTQIAQFHKSGLLNSIDATKRAKKKLRATENNLTNARKELQESKQQYIRAQHQIEAIRQDAENEKARLENQIAALKNCNSMKIGRAITAPIRFLKKIRRAK